MVKGLGIAPGSFLSEGSEVIIHIFPYTARQLNQKMTHFFPFAIPTNRCCECFLYKKYLFPNRKRMKK